MRSAHALSKLQADKQALLLSCSRRRFLTQEALLAIETASNLSKDRIPVRKHSALQHAPLQRHSQVRVSLMYIILLGLLAPQSSAYRLDAAARLQCFHHIALAYGFHESSNQKSHVRNCPHRFAIR